MKKTLAVLGALALLSLAVFLFTLYAPQGRAQAGRYDSWAVDSSNHLVANPTVRVCAYSATPATPCTPLASIYTDKTLATPQANPFTGDAYGNYGWWGIPGDYTVQVSGPAIASYSYAVHIGASDDTSTVLNPLYFSGADECARISSAFAWAISQGWNSATVDARRRAFVGRQNCAASPFAGVSNTGTFTGILLTQGTQFVMDVPIVIPGGIRWDGSGPRSLTDPRNAAGTSVQPSSTYAATHPLATNPIVQYGATADTSSPQKIWLTNMAIGCLAPGASYVAGTGSIGIANLNGEEGSGGDWLDIVGCQTGIVLDVASTSGGAHSGFDSSGFRHVAITVPSDSAAGGIQFGNSAVGAVGGVLADVTGFEDITVTGTPSGTQAGFCADVEGSMVYFKGIRCYYTSKGIIVGNTLTAVAVSIDTVDTEGNVSYPTTTIVELDSHAGYLINVGNVRAGGTTTNIMTDANYPGGACTLLQSNEAGIGFYSRGIGGGANGAVLSTARTACTTTGIFSPLFAGNFSITGQWTTKAKFTIGSSGTATSGANFPSNNLAFCQNAWNGTAGADFCGSIVLNPGSGTNPSATYKVNAVTGASSTSLDLSAMTSITLANMFKTGGVANSVQSSVNLNGATGISTTASGATVTIAGAGLTVVKTIKGSDGNNCNQTFTGGILTATTCP